MALPKYKRTRSRTRSRRSANFYAQISKPEMNKCPRCSSLKRMHFACAECGFYAGRQVYTIRERVKSEPEEQQ